MNEKNISELKKTLADHFTVILKKMGLDLRDPSLRGTSGRMARAWIDELFSGCFTKAPKITTFPNNKKLESMVVIGPIRVNSMCSHHLLPFIGDAFIGYIPKAKILGLSKFARIIDWYARRPQIQEELSEQIVDYLYGILFPLGIGCYIRAKHSCMQIRGIQEPNAWMTTMALRGNFLKDDVKKEFVSYISEGLNV